MRQVAEGRRERATTASSERSSASRSRRWDRLRGARAQTDRNVKGTEAVVWANMLEAVSIAEKIAPYRHHRLAAIKVDAKDLAPRNEQKSLEDLRAQMQKHFERLAPVLDLEALMAPADGSADRDVPQGWSGPRLAAAPRGRPNRSSQHQPADSGTVSDRTPDTDWHRNRPCHHCFDGGTD